MQETDHAVAHRLAAAAGELLLDLRTRGLSGRDLKDAGDRQAHLQLMAALAEVRPEDGVLSEEAVADPARLGLSRVWIVDPLDGTREYGEPPRTDWAVHVALCVDGVAAVGAVALPDRGLTLSTGRALPVLAALDRAPRIAVSRSRPSEQARRVAGALGGELVPIGSAGVKAMSVVLGEVDAYVHAGGMYEWDSAAPVAVAVAAGLHASRLDGSPLLYNRPDPYLPDLLICRPELTDAALEVLA